MATFAFADSHVHLADAAFANDLDQVVERARAAGAQALVCIGESTNAKRAHAIAERFPALVHFTAGLHPHDAASWDDSRDADEIRKSVANGAVAIGECGLDYHYDFSPRPQQRKALEAQLALAAELDRPIVLHTREAEDDTLAMLADARAAGVCGVLHCFTGTLALAEAAIDAGWYVSFSGIITFRNWTDESLLRLVPLDRLLVESDGPYLAPMPNRGKRNESSWVPFTIEKLASVRSMDVSLLAQATLKNARRFFRIS